MTSVDQPERLTIDSFSDPQRPNQGVTNFFTNYFTPPILEPDSISLTRVTVPNVAQPNIPDYSLVFYYYNLPNTTTTPSASTLKAVRLYPMNYQPPTGFTTFTRNRPVSSPSDFVALLNQAAAAGGDNVTYNKLWTAGDITFSYDSTRNQITFTGLTAGRFYANAGFADPVVLANQAITATANAAAINTYNFDTSVSVQRQARGVTMNLRVGYAQTGANTPDGSFAAGGDNSTYFQSAKCANLTGQSEPTGTAVPVDSYPNLVPTQCLYVYADWATGLGQSQNYRNLLCVIPMNTPMFGVVSYAPTTKSEFYRLPNELYRMFITLLDDNQQPWNFPDSANVNIEFALNYKKYKS